MKRMFMIFGTILLAKAGIACSTISSAFVERRIAPNFQPVNRDWGRFMPVGNVMRRQTTNLADMNDQQITEIRDAMIAARLAYSDYSELYLAGILDQSGQVIDLDAFYIRAREQKILPFHDYNWSKSEEEWARERFEILYINEIHGEGANNAYQGNIALSRHIPSGAYFISIGGTDSIPDVMTNIRIVPHGEDRLPSADVIDGYFDNIIPENARVMLSGHSLGGFEVVVNYLQHPERYHHIYPIQALGIGGRDGTYFSLYLDDGIGDAKITEILGDDKGHDFNDMVVSWGYVPAGRVYCIENVVNIGESALVGPDPNFTDSHFLGNMWESLLR